MMKDIRRADRIALRFAQVGNEIVLTQLKGPGNVDFREVATYRLGDMKAFQQSLAEKLKTYQSSGSPKNLESLVEEGWLAYQKFLARFTDDQAKSWWKAVIRDRKRYAAPILELTIPDAVTIPFGLFYVEDPKKIPNWTDYSEIVRGFIGVDVAFHKVYLRKRRLSNSISDLCRPGEPPRVLHSLDVNLPNGRAEIDNWRVVGATASIPTAKPQIVAGWTDIQLPPHLVHCTCHVITDRDMRRYVSCGKGERLYIHDLEGTDVTMPYPPFVFLNSCNGGVINAEDRDNFVWSLFPKVASGFVATTCEVTDSLAVEMARHFYRNFAGGAEVLTAVHQSIRSLVLEKKKLGALAYVLWESDPYLRLRRLN